ncbi:sensor histidine kinase [Paenibacillus sp. GP183]|uniref:sensor histidine kinase n=1 Tax=Paenibacillus sp. GP183 TaxID=1882751 RepID=UPI0008949754|nr:sensor histidine kinase [Paenibacillus sp. GP183]SED07697.1 two-component system, sensor histidine kinase YesM [Paenibacillus sp. GP183]
MFYSLKNRMILVFSALMIFSFGLMSWVIFNESRSIIRSYIESSALEKMDEYGSFIQTALLQVYDLSSHVYNSDVTKTWDAAQSNPSLTEGEKILADIKLSQLLTQTSNSYSGVSSVAIYRKEGLRIGSENQIVQDGIFLQSPWYQNYRSRGNRWASSHEEQMDKRYESSRQVISLLMPIGTFDHRLSESVLKVNLDSNFLLEPLNRIHVGETGSIFLLNQDGIPVLPQNDAKLQSEAGPILETIRTNDSTQGVIYMNHLKGREILVYKKLSVNNWMLASIVSEADLYTNLINLRTTIVIFTLILLILAILIATWLSHGITRPLSRLASAMRYVQKGEFANAENRIPAVPRVRNEIGFVTSAFRNMVQQLKQHIKNEFELKLLRQQAEYKALLMQINPHFLFNTLELISSLALQSRTRDVLSVVDSLSDMMRFSMKINHDLVRLRDELSCLSDYLSILQIRFGEQLVISSKEQGDLERLEIVKFILQPLVENAVKYSLAHRDIAEVTIRTSREAEILRIHVQDNGIGMPPEVVQKLQAEYKSHQFDQVLNAEYRQIGLRNVLARCSLYYGNRFSFVVHSEIDRGTMIELILPAQEGSERV